MPISDIKSPENVLRILDMKRIQDMMRYHGYIQFMDLLRQAAQVISEECYAENMDNVGDAFNKLANNIDTTLV